MRLLIFPIYGLIRSLRNVFYDRINYLQYCTWAITYISSVQCQGILQAGIVRGFSYTRYYKRRMQSRLLLTILHRSIIVQFVIGKKWHNKKMQLIQIQLTYSFSVQKWQLSVREINKLKKKSNIWIHRFEDSWRKVKGNEIRLSIRTQN